MVSFPLPLQSPPKGATIQYRPKPVIPPVIYTGGQAYTVPGGQIPLTIPEVSCCYSNQADLGHRYVWYSEQFIWSFRNFNKKMKMNSCSSQNIFFGWFQFWWYLKHLIIYWDSVRKVFPFFLNLLRKKWKCKKYNNINMHLVTCHF